MLDNSEGINIFMTLKLKKIDLVEGNIAKSLLLFSLPNIFSYFFRYLFNALDIFLLKDNVSQNIVVSCLTPINICIAIIIGVSVGGTFLIGQYHGAKDIKGRNHMISSFGLAMMIFSFALMAIVMAFSPLIVRVLNIDPSYNQEAINYLLVASLSIPLYGMCYFMCGTSKACGKGVFTLTYLFLTCGINMLLDFLFIVVGKLGCMGSATALISANLISTIIMLAYCFIKYRGLKLGKPHLTKLDLLRIVKYSLPAAIQECSLIIAFSGLVSVCNYRGFTTQLAISDRLTELTFCIIYGIGNALTAAIAQNLGAYKIDRVKKYLKWGIIFALIGATLVAPFYACLDKIASIYSPDPEICKQVLYRNLFLYAQLFLCAIAYPLVAIQSGAGRNIRAMLAFAIPSICVQLPLFLGLGYGGASFVQMAVAYPVAEIFIIIIAFFMYKGEKWKDLKSLPVTEDIMIEFKE